LTATFFAVILWQNAKHRAPVNSSQAEGLVPVEVFQTEKNSLNNRFFPLASARTDAMLTLDDDFLFPKELLHCAFCQWKSNTNQIVGLDRRWITHGRQPGKLIYAGGDGSPSFSIVTGQSMLWHRKFSAAYAKLKPLHALVDGDARYCDDIAMNAVASNLTNLPPAYVFIPLKERWWQWNLAKVRLQDGGGLSQTAGWRAHRSNCANLIDRYFHDSTKPLVSAESVFIDSSTLHMC
jgi:hypothetical protein